MGLKLKLTTEDAFDMKECVAGKKMVREYGDFCSLEDREALSKSLRKRRSLASQYDRAQPT